MQILAAREKRAKIINSYIGKSPVIVGTANIPGPDKNLPAANFLVDYFAKLCKRIFPVKAFKFYQNADGPFFVLVTAAADDLKFKLVETEENHPLGRLIDLDLYRASGPKSRRDVGLPPRRCLICDRSAVFCVRKAAHNYRDLITAIENRIIAFLKVEVGMIIDWAITTEAKLDPKFGLVTEKSSGSHSDMAFDLLMKAKAAIIPPLTDIFEVGYRYDFKTALDGARKIGLKAEAAMFRSTAGVNAYKGLIFVLGFTLLALGNCFKKLSFELFEKVAAYGADLYGEFTDEATFGKYAYRKYRISGARGEVGAGLPNVVKVLPLLTDFSAPTLTMTLISLIESVDDTVLLKRAGSLRAYQYYRKLIGSIKTYDLNKIRTLTDYCIKRNLSFGGAADLLIVAIFIKKTEENFQYQYV